MRNGALITVFCLINKITDQESPVETIINEENDSNEYDHLIVSKEEE